MAVSWTDIRDHISGDFASFSQADIEKYLNRALRMFDSDHFGVLADDATEYLTLHMLTLERKGGVAGGTGGVVKKWQAKDFAKEFAVSSGGALSKHALGSTTYGQQYLHLRNIRAGATIQVV
jgi:hypothetical protein